MDENKDDVRMDNEDIIKESKEKFKERRIYDKEKNTSNSR